MSHGVLDSASHVIAGLLLIYQIDQAPFERQTEKILEAARREHRLRVCGSLAAAQANLDDTWKEAQGRDRDHLRQSYDFISGQLESWRSLGVLPSEDRCRVSVEKSRSNPTDFGVEIYRLDGTDSPHRRVNWSYRLTLGRGM